MLGEELGAWFVAQGYRATVEHRDLAREEV
ncbi:MAG: hypothetical protein ACK4UU_06215 [Fimbriimonadales bacterium]